MTIAQMLSQSGILTLLGMGIVFLFLIILILCMNLLHVIVHALKLDKDNETKTEKNAAPSSNPDNLQDNGAIIAAIATAVHEKEQ